MPVLLFEVGVLDYPKHVSKRILYRRHFDSATDVLQIFMFTRAQLEHSIQSQLRIVHAPVGNDAFSLARAVGPFGLQAKFEPTDIETNIERFIKIGTETQ